MGDRETGEIGTRRLERENGEARAFYASATVGIEAIFAALWFERMLGECGHRLWVDDAAEIRAPAPCARRRPIRATPNIR